MQAPPIPANEKERLANLLHYNILDTIDEKEFADLTVLASEICQTPISLISLVDEKRQWFKSRVGMIDTETAREYSFCAYAINQPNELFLVNDASKDVRFFDNPLVVGAPYIQFYAGMPLVSQEGYALGTICVLDNKPKDLTPTQKNALQAISNQISKILELRVKNEMLNNIMTELEQQNEEIEQFSYRAAHDLKSPLHTINGLTDIILNMGDDSDPETTREYLEYIKQSSENLSHLIDAILYYSKNTQIIGIQKELFDLDSLLNDITFLLKPSEKIKIEKFLNCKEIFSVKIALKQIILNLMANAIKYLDRPDGIININCECKGGKYYFSLIDNGPGIPNEALENIFDLFKTNKINKDSGTGVGLATVKKLVEKLGGNVNVKSEPGRTEFAFTIAK